MNKGLKLFFLLGGLFVLITVIVTVFMYLIQQNELLPTYFVAIPVYFIIASAVLGLFVSKAVANTRILQVPVLLGFRMIIVFVGLIFLVVLMFLDKEYVIQYAATFAVYYIIFSVIETNVLMRLSKKKG